ncbi:immunoglobulin-like domain-containing protein [Lachnoclostridium sp. Marseille-P6806]|uniref:immunoglobulin-like domain-containing protein n=1 Tax=Lachnoclostridium sp. Marseille-P6806 TaxID=2364793 RepID=UPI001031339B|nr:immunoglobulin-like domain-containing protein [Lachnoclostridium sp. Marseille-P6806]
MINQYDDREKKGEFLFGEHIRVERKDGEEWKEVSVLQNVGLNDIGYVIEYGAVTEHEYDWSALYGELGPGEYRFRTDISVSGEGQSNIYTAYGHFVIAGGPRHFSDMNGSKSSRSSAGRCTASGSLPCGAYSHFSGDQPVPVQYHGQYLPRYC